MLHPQIIREGSGQDDFSDLYSQMYGQFRNSYSIHRVRTGLTAYLLPWNLSFNQLLVSYDQKIQLLFKVIVVEHIEFRQIVRAHGREDSGSFHPQSQHGQRPFGR